MENQKTVRWGLSRIAKPIFPIRLGPSLADMSKPPVPFYEYLPSMLPASSRHGATVY